MTDRGRSAVAAWRVQLRAGRSLVQNGIALAGLVMALGSTIMSPPVPRLVWNASASAPIGLYAVDVRARVAVGDMVVARIPRRWRTIADVRRYLPANVPAVKRVAASEGDEVCARRRTVFVNDRQIARRRTRDGAGRPLPAWVGCIVLDRDNLFLIMDAAGSFDGRYFGISRRTDILGKAIPVWTRGEAQ